MNQSFYIGAIGAHQQLKRMNIQSNNIANVNTHGFRAEKARFNALMHSDLKGIDDVQLPTGSGTSVWTTATDFSQAPFSDTGKPQDYAISGEGFFAVADLTTGEITFTRNGAFCMAALQQPLDEVDEKGDGRTTKEVYYLSDQDGRFVLSNTGGMIEMTDPNQKCPVGVFDYFNYNGMLHQNDTRFLPIEKNGSLRFGSGTVVQGVLEMSNVDLAEEMTKVIEAQRAYGMALKMVQTSDEIESTINGLRT